MSMRKNYFSVRLILMISSRKNYIERTVYTHQSLTQLFSLMPVYMYINICLVWKAYPILTWWTLPETKVEMAVTASGTECRISIRREMDGPIHGTLITIKSHIPMETCYGGRIYYRYDLFSNRHRIVFISWKRFHRWHHARLINEKVASRRKASRKFDKLPLRNSAVHYLHVDVYIRLDDARSLRRGKSCESAMLAANLAIRSDSIKDGWSNVGRIVDRSPSWRLWRWNAPLATPEPTLTP